MSLHPAIYESFQVVMRSGTISGAAEMLGRSQPAVSRMIDKLEEDMGVKLFERRKGRVVATHAALLLLEEVERLLIRRALDRFDGNVTQAAEFLGLSRSALYRRLEKFELDPAGARNDD